MDELVFHCHEKPYKKRKHKVEKEEMINKPKTNLSFVFLCFSQYPQITLTNPKRMSYYIGFSAFLCLVTLECAQLIGRDSLVG